MTAREAVNIDRVASDFRIQAERLRLNGAKDLAGEADRLADAIRARAKK